MSKSKAQGRGGFRRSRVYASCLLVVAAGLALANETVAQPAGAVADARAKFEQGQAAVSNGDLQKARELFMVSEQLFPRAGTLLNLADCEEKLGLVASAWQHYHDALALLRNEEQSDYVKDRIKLASDRSTALEPRVPKLRIDLVKDAPTGTRVLLDSRELTPTTLGTDMPLDPGDHTVIVKAPGRVDRAFPLKIAEKQHQTVPVEPGAPETPAPAASGARSMSAPLSTTASVKSPPLEPSRTLRNVGIAIGATGIVGVVIGSIAGGLAVEKKGELEKKCPDPETLCTAGLQSVHDGKLFGTISSVGLGVGAPLLVAGGILLSVAPTGSRVNALVHVGPGTAGLTVRGSF